MGEDGINVEEAFRVIGDDKNNFMFKEALEFMKNKVVLPYSEYKMIRTKYKSLAFSVSGYTELEILNTFFEEINKAIEEGTTKEQFRGNMNSFLERNGYIGMSRTKSNIIFQTNLQTAYNVGHYKSMTQDEVVKRRPYWKYLTAGDNKVREEHSAMDGKVYFANDPIWEMWYPPNGFGCRCTVVSLTPEQVKSKGLEIGHEPPYIINKETNQLDVAWPDKAFRNNPAMVDWKPDMVGFPKVLKKAYQDRVSNEVK